MFLFLLFWCSAVAINGELICEDPMSLLQFGDVHEKMNVTIKGDAPVAGHIDMEPVLRCLRLTTPNIQTLKYPSDAEEHFEQLRKVLGPWFDPAAKENIAKTAGKRQYHCSEGYCGPWLENHWIEHFMSTWQNRGKDSTKRLAEVFGPFIPIFMPYNDLWMVDKLEYDKMVLTLQKSIRPDVAYITVVLRAQGLVSLRGLETDRDAMKKIMKSWLVYRDPYNGL